LNQARLYSNVLVKVGVERSYLLSEDKLKALTQCKNLEEFASKLGETMYGKKLAKGTLLNSAGFERVFRENLIEVACKMVKNSPENVSSFLKMRLLGFEHENIKTIVKAVSLGLSHDDIIGKIYTSVEDFMKRSDIMIKAATGIDVKSVVETLKSTVYASSLIDGLRNYEETGSTKFFDILLDRMFYDNLGEEFKNLPKKEQKHASFYVSMETDSFNLSVILRSKILNYDPLWMRMAIAPKSYNIPKETIEALLMSNDFESAFNIVKQSYYSRFFLKAESPEDTVSAAEKTFREAILEHVKKTKVGDLFNIGLVLGFMAQKEVEAYNLTTISLGIGYHWKSDDILRLLIL
jgi:vacuolar-type H+-ATPase subunit C/Vma6